MTRYAEREIDGEGWVVSPRAGERPRRSVTVNLAESPLSWLMARALIDARQFEAGERLRADYEMAALGARVTMRWDAAPVARGRGGSIAIDPTLAQLAAKQRFDAAVEAVGRSLRDICGAWFARAMGCPMPSARLAGPPARAGSCSRLRLIG